MTRIEVIVVGNELLEGDVHESNAHLLARSVSDLGARLDQVTLVPDDVEAIAGALREALARGTTLLITIGGLGPTPDDVTLAGVAHATGRELRLDAGARAFVARRYADLAREGRVASAELAPPREKLARLPEGARWLPNLVGTAPAPVLALDHATVVSLPAPPAEFTALLRGPLHDVLLDAAGARALARARYRLAMQEETPFAPIHDRVQPRHPDVYLKSRFHAFERRGDLLVTLAARGGDGAEARARLEAACADLERALAHAGIGFRREGA